MAHRCTTCGLKCHCGGDIDDLILRENYSCAHCEDDEEWDEDDYYDQQEKLNDLLP